MAVKGAVLGDILGAQYELDRLKFYEEHSDRNVRVPFLVSEALMGHPMNYI